MEKIAIRTFLIIIGVVFQSTIFPVLFSNYHVPNLPMLMVVSWVIVLGFSEAIWLIVLLGIFYDLSSFSVIGHSVIVFTLIAYLTSFLSRRFLSEYGLWKIFVSIFLIFVLTYFYSIFVFFIDNYKSNPLNEIVNKFSFFHANIFFQMIFNGLIFFPIYKFIESIEEFMSFYERKIQIK